ncbi:MAG: polysaccharide deacetylase family protein, partial [Nanoarchaeota archaeon]
NERVWQKNNPEAYIGYYKGIENWRNLLNRYNAKATFFLSTNCFSAENEELNKINNQLKSLLKEKHEIGLHLHPDSDLALQTALKKRFQNTSARFYNYNQINLFIKVSKQLIQKNLGINPTSFRWGNWALNTDSIKALQENGFKIDSSATPGIKGHLNDGMHYDWSKVDEHYPWKLSLNDYQDTKHQNSKVLEIPIATFNFMGKTLRADPVYSELLKAAFDYYYKNADRSKKPFVFVIISHSIESTHEDESITQVIRDMEEFIKHAKKFDDVEFVTIDEVYKKIK